MIVLLRAYTNHFMVETIQSTGFIDRQTEDKVNN